MRSEKLSGDDPEADRCSERLEISTQRLVFKGACALFAKPSAGGKVTKSLLSPNLMVLVCLFWSVPTSNLILIDVADGSCPVVLDTVFSGPRRPAWRIKQLYDRTSPLRLPATTDCFIYLLTEKASFASKADAPRKNWLKFPHNEVVKMMETMPSLGAQLDFYAGTLQHPRLAPWSLERGLVNVYRRTGSILMMPTAKMPNV